MHAVVQAVAVGGRGHHPTKYVETSYLHNIDRDREMAHQHRQIIEEAVYGMSIEEEDTMVNSPSLTSPSR